jgi:L-alanine-DL-glutamate epimerase-like enolase superfamily enzyme
VVCLHGDGHEGQGEDVTYQEDEQQRFQQTGKDLPLAGEFTLDEFSHHLDSLALFDGLSGDPKAPLLRRWGIESAALDLALRQSDTTLAEILGRQHFPVRFVVSTGLGSPPGMSRLNRLWRTHPGTGLKLDATTEWSDALIAELAGTGAVTTVDFKGQYKGDYAGAAPDAGLYARVAEGLPDAWLEDPGWTKATRDALAKHLDRVTFDAPICALADIIQLPRQPNAVNIKPSRFGMISELFRVYAYCEARGIEMYGGGQFELGPGRGQIQYLAGLFHADTPNDVAPSGFNDVEPRADLPPSPLEPSPESIGFRWRT